MKSLRRKAILTFDYEVFMGRKTGSVVNCVIRPTEKVLEILRANDAKGIFFVDATWLLFMHENQPDDFRLVERQLKEIVAAGSSVELHLHPQWLDAIMKDGAPFFESYENYSLHTLTSDRITTLFSTSIKLIEGITGQKVTGFRAGGWCIEPFSNMHNAFVSSDLLYDSSVLPGMRLIEGESYDFDFYNAPSKLYYRFEESPIKSEDEGRFAELPVSTYRNNAIYRIINKICLKLKSDRIYGDGISNKEKSAGKTIKTLFSFNRGMLTIDRTCNILFRYLLKTHFRKRPLLVVVSHPKLESDEAMRNLNVIASEFETLNSDDIRSVNLY